MPARGNKNSAFLDSQSSDDTDLMAVVAQKMQSSWEKQRKEKEARYFKDAQSILDECLAARREEFLGAVHDMNTAYENFVQEYAVVEDEIRKLLLQLSREQQKIFDLAEAKHRKMAESEKARERGHVQGMAVAKKAMEDFARIASSLCQCD